MTTKKRIYNITELQKLQALATKCKQDVTLTSEDGTVVVDAKSFIGLFALDFTKPVLVISDSADFHRAIERIGDTVE
ncbi:MAG: hypothetical protein IJO88_00020 [Oscillospiraceae bacterium]|nr:hypothetical protein [Oscillospiraceae bacterium]